VSYIRTGRAALEGLHSCPQMADSAVEVGEGANTNLCSTGNPSTLNEPPVKI
jgi:hypothetical protein